MNFAELRRHLANHMPDYMVPAACVTLEKLPLTPNGKVDRRALPVPDVVRPDLQEAFVAPRSQSEELVAGIWSKVLGLERIGVHDNFFELGGHSSLAVRLMNEIKDRFDFWIDLHLRQGIRLARELQVRLIEVVEVKMGIAKGMDKLTGLVSGDLGNHHRQQSIGSDVERHTQENIC